MAILKTACVFSLCFLVGLGMFSYTRTPFTVETEYKVRVLFWPIRLGGSEFNGEGVRRRRVEHSSLHGRQDHHYDRDARPVQHR